MSSIGFIAVINKQTRELCGCSTAQSITLFKAANAKDLTFKSPIFDDTGAKIGEYEHPMVHPSWGNLRVLTPFDPDNTLDLAYITSSKAEIIDTLVPSYKLTVQKFNIKVAEDQPEQEFECYLGPELVSIDKMGVTPGSLHSEIVMVPRFTEEQKSQIIEIDINLIEEILKDETTNNGGLLNYEGKTLKIFDFLSKNYIINSSYELVRKPEQQEEV